MASFYLLSQTESLDDGTIAVDVAVVEIVKECTALTYELCQRAGCLEVLVVLLQVLCEVLDTISEKCNLALCRTCVCCLLAILAENLSLLCVV